MPPSRPSIKSTSPVFESPARSQIRYEIKLIVPSRTAADLRDSLLWNPVRCRTAFPPRTVNTVYFDTPQLSCFRSSVQGAFERYKVRLRWYGRENPADLFLEWKTRRGAFGGKERFRVAWSGPLQDREWSEVRKLLIGAVPERLLPSFFAVSVPTLFGRYHRTYLQTADSRCRVTIDERLRYRAPPGVKRVQLEGLLPRSGLILELKYLPRDRPVAERLLQSLQLRPQRCSKYADALASSLL